MKIALIPARMGSQRLKKKNLRELGGVPLITRAIRRCKDADVFDEIWVNAEHEAFHEIAESEGVRFHQRPVELSTNSATSEEYVFEFLQKHACEYLFQVHSIAPLIRAPRVRKFVETMLEESCDVLLSHTLEQIECAYKGNPINFSFDEKTNSQDLEPVQRITWGLTGWRAATFVQAFKSGATATYAGDVGFFALDRAEGHIIKTDDDLKIAEALLQCSED